MQAANVSHVSLKEATAEQRELAVLGLYGTSVSSLELARAYRELLQGAPPDGPVMRGLRGSVRYGMANPAGVLGQDILGKTGTASNPGESWTHVVVISVPHGDGGTAARLARTYFVAVTAEGKSP
jgi:hypothetical protein